MKNSLYPSLALIGLLSLGACKADKDSAEPTGIVGRWQLTDLQCFCIPGPVPNEAVEFKADGTIVYYKDGQENARGTYALTTGKTPCTADGSPVLQTTSSQSAGVSIAAYTLSSSELVLDQGVCLDAPRKTYRRD